MEQEVIFRDYQKAQTSDFNNIQAYAQQSFDDIVGDAITASLRYAGFNTVQSNTAEITVAAGRFYGANVNNQIGAVFTLPTQTIISLVQYLCISQATQKTCTLVVYGVVDQINVQTRDFLTNTQTLQTQPQAVPMTSSRDAVLAIIAGAEGVDPIAPAINVGQVAIANIVVNANGVVSVTMLPTAQVSSTEGLASRITAVETFDATVGPRISTLASDLAALANQLNSLSTVSPSIIDEICGDVAVLKDLAGLPASYAQYGALHFLFPDSTKYDINNTQALGFNCTLFYGVRFPAQNAALFSLSLFNTLDPNAKVSNGLLLPSFNSAGNILVNNEAITKTTSMSQYTYQTYSLVQENISYSRIVAGPSYVVCTNGVTSQTSTGDADNEGWWLPNFSSYEIETIGPTFYPHPGTGYTAYQENFYWVQSWTEPYWTLDVTTHTVTGAQIAQSFLVSTDAWITEIAFALAAVASPTADVWITLCRVTNGQPDLTQVIAHQNIPGTSLVVGWNYLVIQPSFCAKGDRMAIVFTTTANHQVYMCPTASSYEGTFFYSLDGAYFLGDFTQQMALIIWSAAFSSNQVTIEFAALNLAGGIRNIDITARQIIPASCQLVWEVLPAGTGTWLQITPENPLVPFQNAPVLARFRARFIGTSNVMPGIVLNDAICSIWTPGPVFVMVTEPETLATATASITLQIVVQGFDPTAHSLMSTQGNGNGFIKIYKGAGPSYTAINPTTTTVALNDATTGQYTITCVFSGISPTISSFIAVLQGTTNSVADTFLVSTMVWWAA